MEEPLQIDTSLINLLSDLRALGFQEKFENYDSIELPCICVVGHQSSGKSSLLSELVGFKFPTGAGKAVTKCPIECHASKAAEQYLKVSHGNQILHEGGFLEPEGLYNLIKTKTMSKFDITPVIIKQTGPDCHEFSVVDLPGLTADKVEKQQVEQMYNKYIKSKYTIMCIANQASVDLKTNDALTLCSAVDKESERTVLVFTKIDEFNSPDLINLILDKNGYAVRCRTAFNEDLAYLEQQTFEREIWSKFPTKYKGIARLRETLQLRLTKKIKEQLPRLAGQLLEEKRKKEIQMENFNIHALSDSDISFKAGMCLKDFSGQILSFCNGTSTDNILYLFQFLDNDELVHKVESIIKFDLKEFELLCKKFPGKGFKFLGSEQIHLNCVKRSIELIRPILVHYVAKLSSDLSSDYNSRFQSASALDNGVMKAMTQKLDLFIDKTKIKILEELDKKLSSEGNYLTYRTTQIKELTKPRLGNPNPMYEYILTYNNILAQRLVEYLECITKQYFLNEFAMGFEAYCQESTSGRQEFIIILKELLTPSEETKKRYTSIEYQVSQLNVALKLLKDFQ
eukprot:NODE_200_length_13167_cov_0.338537.p2 type:complete len:569 gc:universal NODE_200_length_13167_cov_0.338537:11296-13002(+)